MRRDWRDWVVRGYLAFAAVQGLGIGLTGLVAPSEMQIPLRLTPLNARFVATLYVAGAIAIAIAATSPRRLTTRLFCLGFGLATGMILVLTIVHWPDFMDESLPHRPVWMFDYIADPLLALLVVPIAGLWPARQGTRHALSALLVVEAVLFTALGLLLVLAPGLAVSYWPWSLPSVAGQLYGCFFIALGVGAVLAARETEVRAVRDFLIGSCSLCVLVLLASALHLDRFKPEPITALWFAAFGVGALAFGRGVAVSTA